MALARFAANVLAAYSALGGFVRPAAVLMGVDVVALC